jgi:hypothetical protein
MHVMVQQVAILRDESWRRRRIVIGSKCRRDAGIVEHCEKISQSIGVHDYIGIHECDNRCERCVHTRIAGACGPAGRRREYYDSVCAARDASGFGVVASIIDNDELPSVCGEIARPERCDAALQISVGAVRRNDDAESRRHWKRKEGASV